MKKDGYINKMRFHHSIIQINLHILFGMLQFDLRRQL